MTEKLTRHADASQEMVRPVVVRFYYPLWVSPTSSLGSYNWSTSMEKNGDVLWAMVLACRVGWVPPYQSSGW